MLTGSALSAILTNPCDISAALLADPLRQSEPVDFKDVDGDYVIDVCTKAIELDPQNTGRYLLQRARGHLRNGNVEKSMTDLIDASKLDYPAAYFGLGVSYLIGDSVSKNHELAEYYLLTAYKKGVIWAAKALADLYAGEKSMYFDREKSISWAEKFEAGLKKLQ